MIGTEASKELSYGHGRSWLAVTTVHVHVSSI